MRGDIGGDPVVIIAAERRLKRSVELFPLARGCEAFRGAHIGAPSRCAAGGIERNGPLGGAYDAQQARFVGLRAAGDAPFTMTVSVISMWTFRVGSCYLMVLAFHGGLMSIWVGMYLDWALRSLCFAIRFLRGKWLDKQVI